MIPILAITIPIYGAIALGYLVVSQGWFSKEDMRTLGRFVLNVALPALLFNAAASREISAVFQPDYALVYGLGGLAAIIAAWVLLTLRNTDRQRRALGVMGSSCPNSGFIGYPIMLMVSPDLAGVILALNMLVESLLLIPVCLLLMELASSKTTVRLGRRILTILANVLKMPMVIGLLLGLVVSFSGLPVPGPVDKLIGMLAVAGPALSLVVIGGSLVGLPLHGNKSLAAQITVTKLLVHPALIALIAALLTRAGIIALSPDLHRAVILSAAMPMFGIYTVLAQKHGLEGVASLAMLSATTVAFVTLSVFLFALT